MLSLYTIFKIGHIAGVALGAGGAVMSDSIFFSSIKDKKITQTEMRFLVIGSRVVWVGVLLLILSGLGLVYLNPEHTLTSHKFWAKMTIVGAVIINGIIFHFYHLPLLRKHVGVYFPSAPTFVRRVPLLLASGVVSSVSWASAIILGILRGVPYSYTQIMGVYISILFIGIICALLLRKRIIPHLEK